VLTKILILVLLLGLAFVLSAAEVALYTITRSGEPVRGKLMSRVFHSPQLLLSTILVSNAVAVFLFTLTGASVAIDLAEAASISKAIAIAAEVLIVSTLLILFADAVPKLMALRNARLVVKLSFPLLMFLLVVESPVVYPLNSFLSRLTSRRKRKALTIDSEGLKTLSLIAGSAGVIEEQEAQLLRKISFLGERKVKDTMTPREEMISISSEASFDEVVEIFRRSEHSRIPVYTGSNENVIGMLYARDFLPLFRKKAGRKKFRVEALMRAPVFVPESQSLERLLETYRSQRLHIAVVVDEFGGLSGIVTLSDVVREIFGSSAEMPREKTDVVRLPDNSVLAKGNARLEELAPAVGPFDFEYESGDSVSSLLIRERGTVPRVGSRIPVGNFEFEIVQATPKAILQVKLRQLYSGSAATHE
jgi:magnesium and cobalt exporter, CNNM family